MTLSCVAVAGWTLAGLLGAWALEQRRRLELVARADHELRGPAALLFLAVERMRRDPAGRGYAAPLETELERLRAGLADLAAARDGRHRRRREDRSELEPLVRSSLDAWRSALRAAGRPVCIDWRAGRAAVRADRGSLARAVGNVVANAAEHGEGPVELRAERNGRAVRLEVRNGSGAGSDRPGRGRGRGLRIASDAARDAGGSLRLVRSNSDVVAELELPGDEDRGDPPRAA